MIGLELMCLRFLEENIAWHRLILRIQNTRTGSMDENGGRSRYGMKKEKA